MNSRSLQDYFLLALIVGSLWLAGIIFEPFLTPLVLAIAFAVVLYPLYGWFEKNILSSQNGAAFLTLLTATLGIVLPVAGITSLLGSEAARLYASFADGTAPAQVAIIIQELQSSLPQQIPGVSSLSQDMSAHISEYGKDALTWITNHIGTAFSSIAILFLKFFVFLIALFFFLRDGVAFRKAVITLSPLPDEDDEVIFKKLEIAITSVIRGNLLIALIRGLLSVAGFAFFGVPNSILWGMLAGIAGLVPGIGISIVFGPSILYAYVTGGLAPAIGLLSWGVLAVGLVDNVLGPKLVGDRAQLHPLFVILAIFGGIDLFGPVGIFLGPLSMSLLIALLSIYAKPAKKVSP